MRETCSTEKPGGLSVEARQVGEPIRCNSPHGLRITAMPQSVIEREVKSLLRLRAVGQRTRTVACIQLTRLEDIGRYRKIAMARTRLGGR